MISWLWSCAIAVSGEGEVEIIQAFIRTLRLVCLMLQVRE